MSSSVNVKSPQTTAGNEDELTVGGEEVESGIVAHRSPVFRACQSD